MPNRHRTGSSVAMADIAFLLLLFFMVMAIATQRTPASLAIPETFNAEAETRIPLENLYIALDGSLSTQDGPLDMATYLKQLEKALERQPETRPGVLADKRTPYRLVAPVIKQLQDSGIQEVVFLVGNAQNTQEPL